MGQHDAAPQWWADVEYLREDIERRRFDRQQADRDDLAARRAARARRQAELEEARASARLAVGSDILTFDEPSPRRISAQQQAASVEPGYYDIELTSAAATPARRTVEIRGHGVPAPAVQTSREATGAGLDRRRPARRPSERVGHNPDRVALWGVMMALMLILIAVGTA